MQPSLSALLVFGLTAAAQTPPPVLFFSDLASGSATGGENGNGAYVSVFGNFLGSNQGSSTIALAGTALVNCKTWGPWANFPSGQPWIQKITCQIPPAASSGNIVVTVAGQQSNGIPFTVRPGNIYFVSGTGNDSNAGTLAAPWLTLPHAVQTMAPEGILYAMNGSDATVDDHTGMNAALGLYNAWCGAGPNGYPRAAIVYPGHSVTIGSAALSPPIGIRTTGPLAGPDEVCQGFWTFSGFNLRGNGAAALNGPSSNWRIIGNDVSCPNGNGEDACMHTGLFWNNFDNFAGGSGCSPHPCNSPANNLGATVLGNVFHDMGVSGAMSEYHALYFGTDTRHSEAGWNLIYNLNGCRGIETNSSVDIAGSGQNMFDLHFHDNIIHDTQCEAIDFNDVDPSQGPVEAYNNIVYNTGKGKVSGGGGWNCFAVSGAHESPAPVPSGSVLITNNTGFQCGSLNLSPPYAGLSFLKNGAHSPTVNGSIRNNIIFQNPNGNSSNPVMYWDDELNGTGIIGAANLMWGLGTPPATSAPPSLPILTGTIYGNPLFANVAGSDFHLQSTSPAIAVGAPTAIARDIEGKIRPAVPALGALEFASGITPPPTPQVSGLSCTPSTVTGPATAQCTVTITSAAPTVGLGVLLSSSTVAVTVAPSVTVLSGFTTAQFPATAAKVPGSTAATITATAGTSATAVITDLPAPVQPSCTHTFRWAPQGAIQAFRNGILIPAGGLTITGKTATPNTFADGDIITYFYVREVDNPGQIPPSHYSAPNQETQVCTGNQAAAASRNSVWIGVTPTADWLTCPGGQLSQYVDNPDVEPAIAIGCLCPTSAPCWLTAMR